jgi:serine/alanine adding enzyme
MLEKYSLFNASEMNQWDDFVKSHPKGSPFHLTGWAKTICETYAFEPLLYVCKDGDGRISGVFPLFLIKSLFTGTRIVSLPFSDYGGPLFTNEEKKNDFLERIIEERKNRIRYFEIRGVLSSNCGFVEHSYYKRHVLQLFPDPPKVLKKVDKRTIQYSIRKAQRSGVEVREENNQQGMEEFQRLNKLTRMKHGVPSQPSKFFKSLLENMVQRGDATILVALYGSKVVAAGLFLKCNETFYYKYNASDPGYLSKVTPNHLLTWRAIEMACLQGYHFFDFGRTSPDNEGLMRYKEMWGAQPMDLGYYYFPKVRGAASTEEKGLPYRMLTKVWRSLPEAIIDVIGPKIYKHTA